MLLKSFYRSGAWVEFREAYLARRLAEDGEIICDYCHRPIVHRWDLILHHTVPLDDRNFADPAIALNPERIQAVHLRCHNEIHAKGLGYKAGERQVYLVWGPPCAGKSIYVGKTARPGDLIVDVEAIYKALSPTRTPKVLGDVIRVRDLLIDSIARRQGHWLDAWVVGGYPIKAERERLIDRLGAIPIFLAYPKGEMLERERRRHRNRPDLVEKWYFEFERSGGA